MQNPENSTFFYGKELDTNHSEEKTKIEQNNSIIELNGEVSRNITNEKFDYKDSENSALKKGSKFNIRNDQKKECNFDKIINNLAYPNGNQISKEKDKFNLDVICKFIIFNYNIFIIFFKKNVNFLIYLKIK